jgi:dTDP-4-amino-4,6-dideoxygalactose transaminase
MLTTNDEAISAHLDMLRNHGGSISEEQRHLGAKPYLLAAYDIVGYNYRMTDLQGAVASVQIKKLEGFIQERNHWAGYYSAHLQNLAWLRTPEVPDGYKHGWQSYVTFVDESKAPMSRNEMMEVLQKKGIATRPGTHAVHMLGAYANRYGFKPNDFPGAYAADQYSMAIPLHNKMVKDDYDYIIEALNSL